MKFRIKQIWKDERYRIVWLLLYGIIYILWFSWLEETITNGFHVICTEIDKKIPFCEYFIIPYLLWFLYIAFALFYFGFKDREEFFKLCSFLVLGMTVFLAISTIYPNGHYLRPSYFERDNIFVDLVKMLYQTDTSTNVFPSIHVYNSIGIHIAVRRSRKTQNRKIIRCGSAVLMVSIILSTMFLKQHSIIDVAGGILMAAGAYMLVYLRKVEHPECIVSERRLRARGKRRLYEARNK